MSRTHIATTSTPSTSTPACVEVHYQVTGSLDAYRTRAAAAAPHLAGFPGLVWKLWLLDEPTGEAAGIYLFADAAAAHAFIESPLLDALRQSPGISGVRARVLPVVPDLSRTTFGERAGV
jgi:hypothetical protein